jgi:hypothetical protein
MKAIRDAMNRGAFYHTTIFGGKKNSIAFGQIPPKYPLFSGLQ